MGLRLCKQVRDPAKPFKLDSQIRIFIFDIFDANPTFIVNDQTLFARGARLTLTENSKVFFVVNNGPLKKTHVI